MATMFSNSVITNSCIKPPVNPRTGLYLTQDERKTLEDTTGINGNFEDYDADKENESNFQQSFQVTRSVNFDTTPNTMMDTLANADLSRLSDDEFYTKLVELKTEHRRTLELCEQMYNEKLADQRRTGWKTYPSAKQESSLQPVTEQSLRSSLNSTAEQSLRRSFNGTASDNVKDMSGKPPSGRPKTAEHGSRNVNIQHAQTSSGVSKSLNEQYWRVSSARTSDSEDGYDERNNHLNDSRSSSKSRIEEMWENFSVEEYAPRESRPTRKRSSSLSRISTKPSSSRRSSESKEWKHSITIPKPFKMTLRESSKSPTRSKAVEEAEQKRLEQEREEEEECQKKFKAKPVPAHVYMPLYDEIMDEMKAKSNYNRQSSEEVLKSMQKPFKFSVREDMKKQSKSKKATRSPLSKMDAQEKKTFKAKPAPSFIYDNTVNEKIREEEEYRQLRIQMRSHELMSKSSLPPNMAARGKAYTDGKLRQKLFAERAKMAGFTTEHKFKPKVNDDVPDFEELHKNFLAEMGARKNNSKGATVCKPFNLRPEKVVRRNIYEDIANDAESFKGSKWAFKSARDKTRSGPLSNHLSRSIDSIPSKMTNSAALRESSNKERLAKQVEAEIAELEAERRRRQKEKQLKKAVIEKALANDQTYSLNYQKNKKLQEYRKSEKLRQQEYEKQLNEMKERIDKRPFLFEQTMQMNAKMAAERKYKEKLKNAGVDENFVTRYGSVSTGMDDPLSGSDDEMMHSGKYSQRSVRSMASQRSAAASHRSAASQRSAASASRSQSKKYTDDFEEDEKTNGTYTPDDFSGDEEY